MQGPETNIDRHHLGEDLEHSEDHRWSKFVTKTVVFKLTVRREGNILLMAKKLPRQIKVSCFIA